MGWIASSCELQMPGTIHMGHSGASFVPGSPNTPTSLTPEAGTRPRGHEEHAAHAVAQITWITQARMWPKRSQREKRCF